MLVDSHCHLDFPALAKDLDAVVARAKAAGVDRIVTISTRVKRLPELLAITDKYPNVFCSVGTHPHQAEEEDGIPAEEIIKLAAHPKVVAIGEAGLDNFYKNANPATQERGFREHIRAARVTGLPLVIHTRHADEQTQAVLEDEMSKGQFRAVLHCYTGGMALAQRAVELGCYVSFTGILTFNKSDDLRAIAAALPLDRIFVETDSPFLAPEPHRGQRCEPAFVAETAKMLAKVRGVSFEDICRITTENFERLFDKVPKRASS